MGTKSHKSGKAKLAIVLKGLKGTRTVSELCNDYGITQGLYYKRREQLLADGAKLFEHGGVDRAKERLEYENRKLKETIGELTLELKKRLVKRHYRNSKANTLLIERMKILKVEHLFWGYRRIWAYLKFQENQLINHKQVYRLMQENILLVQNKLKLKATRTNVLHKPRATEPNEYWVIDMTKVMIPSLGWVYIHVVIDWGSKKLLSTYMSLTSKTSDWLSALNEAVNLQFSDGIKSSIKIPKLVSDHGRQPTSSGFAKACSELNIVQIFASYGNPKGNADTERAIRNSTFYAFFSNLTCI